MSGIEAWIDGARCWTAPGSPTPTLDALEQKYTPAEVAELEQGSSTDSEAQAEIMDIVTSCLSEIQ